MLFINMLRYLLLHKSIYKRQQNAYNSTGGNIAEIMRSEYDSREHYGNTEHKTDKNQQNLFVFQFRENP